MTPLERAPLESGAAATALRSVTWQCLGRAPTHAARQAQERGTSLRTLLVHADVDEGAQLLKALTAAGLTVTWLRSLGDSLAFAASQWNYDSVLLDCSGFAAAEGRVVQRFRDSGASLPLVALTACEDLAERMALLEAGADDCLLKPVHLIELITRLRVQARRIRRFDADAALRIGRLCLLPLERKVEVDGQARRLTKREFHLLWELAHARGRVVRRETLLNRVWGALEQPADTAVEYVVHMIRKKVGYTAVRTVPGVGYALGTGTAPWAESAADPLQEPEVR